MSTSRKALASITIDALVLRTAALVTPDGMVHFQLPYGTWIRLFRRCGLIVEDLLEPAAPSGAMPPYLDEQRRSWAQRWPFECIWKARKAA